MQSFGYMEDMFGRMLHDPVVGEQLSTLDMSINDHSYNLGGDMQEWENNFVLSDTGFSSSAQSSSQEVSQSSSLSPQSTSEDVIMLNDQDEICYGMVSKRSIYLGSF
jgi:hypothetical protein